MGLWGKPLISASHPTSYRQENASSHTFDGAEAVESYRAGFDLFNGVNLEIVMKTHGLKMHTPDGWDSLERPSHEVSQNS